MIKTIIVLDTNIFISAVFWEGKPYNVVKKAINQEIIVFISNYIIDEIRKVLVRDFNLEKQEIEDIVNAVLYFTHLIEPKESVTVIKDDPKDDTLILKKIEVPKANEVFEKVHKWGTKLAKKKGWKEEDFIKKINKP